MTRPGEDGFVAGGEALALGVVVFIGGVLLVLAAWSLVDAQLAVEAAARGAVRAVVEAPAEVLTDGRARAAATDDALATLTAHRGDPADGATWSLVETTVTGDAVRCGLVAATVVVDVATVRLPVPGGGFGTVRLTGTHRERIDPYAAGLPIGVASC